MIISFIYYAALSKFVDSSFPQCNVHTGVHGGCWAFTPLNGFLKLWELLDVQCNHSLFSQGLLSDKSNLCFIPSKWDVCKHSIWGDILADIQIFLLHDFQYLFKNIVVKHLIPLIHTMNTLILVVWQQWRFT